MGETKELTLKDVFRIALEDKEFMTALLKNPEEALQAKKITMSENERQELQVLIEKTNKLPAKEIWEFINYCISLGLAKTGPEPWPWPPAPVVMEPVKPPRESFK